MKVWKAAEKGDWFPSLNNVRNNTYTVCPWRGDMASKVEVASCKSNREGSWLSLASMRCLYLSLPFEKWVGVVLTIIDEV